MNDKTVNQNQVYTATETAKILGVNPRTIVKLCKNGKIKSIKLKEYKILGESIIDFLKGETSDLKEDEKSRNQTIS